MDERRGGHRRGGGLVDSCKKLPEVLLLKLASPLYAAVMTCVPPTSCMPAVARVAVPLLIAPVPMDVPLSLKVITR